MADFGQSTRLAGGDVTQHCVYGDTTRRDEIELAIAHDAMIPLALSAVMIELMAVTAVTNPAEVGNPKPLVSTEVLTAATVDAALTAAEPLHPNAPVAVKVVNFPVEGVVAPTVAPSI